MKPKATKVVKKTIALEEREMAAKYFTMSNCAVLDLMQSKNILREYDNVNGIVASECPCDLSGELKSWVKEVAKAKEGDYVYDEWQKVKSEYITEVRVAKILEQPTLEGQKEFFNQINSILK